MNPFQQGEQLGLCIEPEFSNASHGGWVLSAPADLLIYHALNGVLGGLERLVDMDDVSNDVMNDAES
jgi:hypothetical protein